MFEVEAKIHLKHREFKKLFETLSAELGKHREMVLEDFYFGDFKNKYLRVRKIKGKHSLLTMKKKRLKEGMEVNLELEWNLKNPENLIRYLRLAKIPAVRKKKESIRFKKGGVTIELNRVEGLGYFLEIEAITSAHAGVFATQKKVLAAFRALGYLRPDFEKKYYLELLREKEKNS